MKDPKELDDPQLFVDPSYSMIPSYVYGDTFISDGLVSINGRSENTQTLMSEKCKHWKWQGVLER